MEGVRARILNIPQEDEHLVRRLGKSVIAQWDLLPKEIQERIREQAVFMHDRHETVQLNEQLQSLIAKWKGVE